MSAHDYSDADDYVRLLNEPINVELNDLVERVALATPRLSRSYLGASSAGDECLRKIQLEWLCSSFEGARQRLRFYRGHAAEATMRAQLSACGFEFASPEALEFAALEYLKGHADGILIAAPHLSGVHRMPPAIWECKMIYAKGWRALVKDGLAKTYPKYATQVALYQHFLHKENSALFTAINADSCEALHLLVPYDGVRAGQAIARITVVIDATKAQRLLERAYHGLQAEMFREAASVGGLSLQLVYYRGIDECRASGWTSDPAYLARTMSTLDCRAGHTQIGRVLIHAKNEAAKQPVGALVFVGDAMEESLDILVTRARELGRLKVPVFMFQEGRDSDAESAFRAIARSTGGAYGRFDAGAAKQLGELLKAVALFAAGDVKALEKRGDAGSVLLLGQLKGGA